MSRLAPAVFLFALASAGSALASPQPSFICDVTPNPLLKVKIPAHEKDGQKVAAEEYDIDGNVYYADGDRIAFTAYPYDDAEWWPRVPAASGVKYEKDGISFHHKADKGILSLSDGTDFKCLSYDTKYPAAKSIFGTRLRETPDPSGKLIQTFPQGYPMSIYEQTGQFYDGWQWVKIDNGEGESGYVWGGTVCTTKVEVKGVHFGCN